MLALCKQTRAAHAGLTRAGQESSRALSRPRHESAPDRVRRHQREGRGDDHAGAFPGHGQPVQAPLERNTIMTILITGGTGLVGARLLPPTGRRGPGVPCHRAAGQDAARWSDPFRGRSPSIQTPCRPRCSACRRSSTSRPSCGPRTRRRSARSMSGEPRTSSTQSAPMPRTRGSSWPAPAWSTTRTCQGRPARTTPPIPRPPTQRARSSPSASCKRVP